MAWGNKVRKYRPGPKMLGIFDLISAFDRGFYVFVDGKAYHPAVLRNWSLLSLERACKRDAAFVAELTPEWEQKQQWAQNLCKMTERKSALEALTDAVFGEGEE